MISLFWDMFLDKIFCESRLLFESLSNVMNQESHVFLWNKFGENLPRSFFEIYPKFPS